MKRKTKKESRKNLAEDIAPILEDRADSLPQGAPLVTHNAKDFEGVPSLEVITERV